MSELRGLGGVQERLEKSGGTIAAVSVDEPKLAKKVVDSNELQFPILCDTDRKLTAALDLVHEGASMDGQDIPVPAHLLVDKGNVVWQFVAPRIQSRPDPSQVLAAIENAGL